MSAGFVNAAIELIEQKDPRLVVVHLPDADETAHQHGPDSDEYDEVVARIDTDISRLVGATQDDRTTFVITADHGHIDGGGHGGWENAVTRVPAVFVGPDASLDSGQIDQMDIAATASVALGLRPPRNSAGKVREEVLGSSPEAVAGGEIQYREQAERYLQALEGSTSRLAGARTYEAIDVVLIEAQDARLASDRAARLPLALAMAAAALVAIVMVGALSWRALVAAGAGALGYYAIYNGLYFVVHGHEWSLSAFNTEDYVEMFFNIRMVEAAISGVVAVLVAAMVYPLLRQDPKGARGDVSGRMALSRACRRAGRAGDAARAGGVVHLGSGGLRSCGACPISSGVSSTTSISSRSPLSVPQRCSRRWSPSWSGGIIRGCARPRTSESARAAPTPAEDTRRPRRTLTRHPIEPRARGGWRHDGVQGPARRSWHCSRSKGQLKRIAMPVDPKLEIGEITDRVSKQVGPALLFENPIDRETGDDATRCRSPSTSWAATTAWRGRLGSMPRRAPGAISTLSRSGSWTCCRSTCLPR